MALADSTKKNKKTGITVKPAKKKQDGSVNDKTVTGAAKKPRNESKSVKKVKAKPVSSKSPSAKVKSDAASGGAVKKSTQKRKSSAAAARPKSVSTKKKPLVKSGAAASKSKKKTAIKKSSPTAKRKTPQVKTKKRATGKTGSRALAVKDKNLPVAEEEYVDPSALERGDDPMTVVDHLDEFRSRILIVLGTIIVLTIAGFFFSDYLLKVINDPFESTGHKLNIFKLTGGFLLRLKVSVIAGIMLSMPILIYNVWRYISPAVSLNDRRFSRIAISASVLLFYAGVAFVFFLLLPFAIKMLLSFIGEDMLSTIGANDYLSFILLSSMAMGILFELPIVVMVLTKIGILTPSFLIQKRKYAVVLAWIIAALITPQDIVSQILVAIPLMFLYEVSIILSRFMIIRKKKKAMEE